MPDSRKVAQDRKREQLERARLVAELVPHKTSSGIIEREAYRLGMWNLVDMLVRLGLWGTNTTGRKK